MFNQTIRSISRDHRIPAILIAFGLGSLLAGLLRLWAPAQLIDFIQGRRRGRDQEVYLVWAGTPRTAAPISDAASTQAENGSRPSGRHVL